MDEWQILLNLKSELGLTVVRPIFDIVYHDGVRAQPGGTESAPATVKMTVSLGDLNHFHIVNGWEMLLERMAHIPITSRISHQYPQTECPEISRCSLHGTDTSDENKLQKHPKMGSIIDKGLLHVI
jgi:hypothetical protein